MVVVQIDAPKRSLTPLLQQASVVLPTRPARSLEARHEMFAVSAGERDSTEISAPASTPVILVVFW